MMLSVMEGMISTAFRYFVSQKKFGNEKEVENLESKALEIFLIFSTTDQGNDGLIQVYPLIYKK